MAVAAPAAFVQAVSAQVASPQASSPRASSALTLDCGDVTSLSCADLVPTPDLRQVRARLTLTPPSSPFGVSVRPTAGRWCGQRSTIDGLPDPATLGEPGTYRVYVAWVTTLTMSQETRLGEVKNGHTELGRSICCNTASSSPPKRRPM